MVYWITYEELIKHVGSDQYISAFPNEYTFEEVRAARKRIDKKNAIRYLEESITNLTGHLEFLKRSK